MTGRTTRRQVLGGLAGLPLAGVLPGVGCTRETPRATREIDISAYDTALLPREHGQLTRLTGPLRRRYPSREHGMQMAAFFSARRGLLVIAKDARGGVADWEVLPGQRLKIHFYGDVPEVETLTIEPTLEAAAAGYRQWARKQPWVVERRRTARGLSFISQASLSSLALERAHFEQVRSAAGSPAGMWLTQWRRYPFDRMYPDYGAREPEQLASTLTALRTSGALAFPYVNGLLWDQGLVSFQDASARAALRTPTLDTAPYSSELNFLRYACPHTDAWQNCILRARAAITDSTGQASGGVYLDMLAATEPLLCWATDHGHAPGDPYAWQRGIRALLHGAGGAIMVEGSAEVYLDRVDYMLMHLYTDQSDTVPLWTSVYGDQAYAVGWRLPVGVTATQLQAILARAREFKVGGFATPWMTTEPERDLFDRGVAQAALKDQRARL
jgi:hypothetical protein